MELGCGRGEFLNEFVNNKIDGYGVDLLDYCKESFQILNLKTDMANEKLPYEDNFDVIYSKSIVEHFYYPDKYF